MKIIIFVIFQVLTQSSYGQIPLEIKVDRNTKGEIIFQATNTDFCDYYVTLHLEQVSNTTISSPVMVNVRRGTSQILKLTPQKPNEPVNLGPFRYSYTKGNSRTKMDASFLYLLPVKEGKSTDVLLQKSLSEFLGKADAVELYSLSFSMSEGDTVYASRGGIVCKTNSGNSAANPGAIFTTLTNSVEIFHADGSFARYDLFKNEGILVKPGNKVEAGDPIGIIGKIYAKVSVGFLVYYLDEKKINNIGMNPKGVHSFLKPRFIINESGGGYIDSGESYTAIKPETVITQEMTKREKEKFLADRKK